MNDELLFQRIQTAVWRDQEAHANGHANGCCPFCGGLGVVSVKAPLDHPAFGKLFKCLCQREAVLQKSWKASGVPRHREQCSFEWFDALSDLAQKGKTEAREKAARFARGEPLEDSKHWLVFLGDNGMGKSSLMACIAMAWVARGVQVLWTDFNEFIEAVLESYEKDATYKTSDITEPVRTAQLLCLDDFGDAKQQGDVSDHTRKQTYNVLRYRYEHELPTIITSNLNYHQMIGQFGKRISERVLEMGVWAPMTGLSLRFPTGGDIE